MTNFAVNDFQDGTIKEMIPLYNREWEPYDYMFKEQNEVQVITNLFILANQTQGLCPGYGNFCNDTIKCKINRTNVFAGIQSGILTGRCVKDDRYQYQNQSTCEIRGTMYRMTN